MFYSHQLLARKAPLGQIWMAATMHAKINRKKLCKLNIIKICEEILNPSVPMALRLSGILMGGVVIVYERKVKLLYDDVSRLLVELNEAWKVKAIRDPTVLPKGKTQARYEAVTLPDVGDVEFEFFISSSVAVEELPRKRLRMQLDDVDEDYININPDDDGISEQHHQVDPINITLLDRPESIFQQENLYKRFERFDVAGDDETYISFTPIDERTEIPTTLVPSPQHLPDHHMEEQGQQQRKSQQTGECEKKSSAGEDVQEKIRAKRKGNSRFPRLVMDEGLLIIQADIYQTWLQDTSNIISKKPRQTKQHRPMHYRKIGELMDLPPVALISGLDERTCQIHYPEPLLNLWLECCSVHPAMDTLSEGGSPRRSGRPSTYSRTEGLYPQDVAFEDVGSGVVETLRANLKNMEPQIAGEASVTPGIPGKSATSAPSSGSGPRILPEPSEVRISSGRSKRRQLLSSNNSFGSLGSLDRVEEDVSFEELTADFKLKRVSENGLNPDFDLNNTELLEETAQLPTPIMEIPDPTTDKLTQTIRTHLKTHFDTPGVPNVESLNNLATGMSKHRAAQLFYQTCVLATLDVVKVEQTVPYGDISISRGHKM